MQSIDRVDAANKTLILVHGRGFKPPKAELEALWLEALRSGLTRDFADPLTAWRRCRREFVYYGDEIAWRARSARTANTMPRSIWRI